MTQEDIYITFKYILGRRDDRGRNRREEAIFPRLRIGHTGINKTLHIIGKHPTGRCIHCDQHESVQHVLLDCRGYEMERKKLRLALKLK